ncbi:MAG: Asp-tRNA(Asn)/Glu-tRNA(Gln) amidotransferase subunit GatB [Candidatus Falkowbacteria bacterium]|nr:Asp-tRNA(Asn)/Glu-tRNA(Gln) amidotransferase subunit GatB [Candidatus Falkowbacteria bacterium]
MKYDVIIGLEIHAELKTKSKMFCSCDNNPFNFVQGKSEGKEPNSVVCPICLGHPGTLPVPNKQAIAWTILTGLALRGKVNRQSKFDRKNYFYPDLPKGYQISQYDLPLVYDAYLEIDGKKIAITRIHLEEDTGKLSHPSGADFSLIDFNRAGTPLMELVTKPVIHDAQTAKKFCQTFQQILRYLNISDANMEKGEMRCEANISVQKQDKWEYDEVNEIKPTGKNKLNPKIELKNLNSFKAIEKGIEYEIARQIKAIESGKKLVQETRGWDENKKETVRQRVKETSADYRYFPEPDIPPLNISHEWLNEIKVNLIELPPAKKNRFKEQYGLSDYHAEILVSDKALADYTEQVISELCAWINATGDIWERQKNKLTKLAADWLISELFKHLNTDNKNIKDIKITPENFAELITLVYQNKINSTTAQKILKEMYNHGGDPTNIMDEMGLQQLDDTVELEKIVVDVIKENPDQVLQYKSGKTALLQFFIGKTMAATNGQANPKIVTEILLKLLK